jgi:MFS transporter, DHA1 family, multidrug resistance protein
VRFLESWKKNLLILWIGVFFSSVSYTMVVPFLPLYLLDLGVSEESVKGWSGLVFSAAFFVGAIMAPYWGARADKVGKRRMVIRAGICLTIVYVLTALVRNPWELLAVRILQGLANGFISASMAIVASSTPKIKMGWSLGVMQTASATGGIFGPLFGGILSELFGMRLSFIASSVAMFLATMAVWIFIKEDGSHHETESRNIIQDLKAAWRNPILMKMLGILLIVQMVVMILQPLLTIYIAQLQGGFEGAVLSSGIIFSLSGVAVIIASPSWGRIGQNKGFFYILFIALLGSGVINLSQVFVEGIWGFSVIQFMFGLLISGVLLSTNTLVVQYTDANFQGRAFGLTTSATQLGSMIGPLIGGLIGSWMSIKYIFAFTGFLLVLTGFSTWRSIKTQKGSMKQSIEGGIESK